MDTSALDDIAKQADELKQLAIKIMGQVAEQVPKLVRPRTPIDTGNLRRKWTSRHYNYQTTIRNTAPYAEFVDGGTKKMQARPMLSPMLPLIESEIYSAFQEGRSFNLGSELPDDEATTQKKKYKAKYGNYGSQRGYSA